jgi:LysR family transcriptional regulator, benzoate and cis,cis-muconate-responsive activator of ben and cat genes
MPELRHLRYFVAVAEELNFSRAARRLQMAQPPLSVAIRQLEAELGTRLFRRSSREVTLTAAGNALLEGARRTLVEAEAAVAAARRAAAGELGGLRIGFSWSARFETLPALGQAFRSQRPDVDLMTQEVWNSRMAGALRDGSIDLAVALCPEVCGEFTYTPIRREGVVTLMAASHPLAGEQAICLSAIADEQLVLFPRDLAPRLFDILVGLCRQAGFEPSLRRESFHTGWELGVLADVPVLALTPESVAQALPPGVVAVPVSGPQAPLETCIVCRAGDPSPTLAAFVNVARGVFDTSAVLI